MSEAGAGNVEQPGSAVPLGSMQPWSMTLDRILSYAATQYPQRAVVMRGSDGNVFRSSYRQIEARARRFSAALANTDIGLGDRVGTLLWNNIDHLASWFGANGIGAVTHTLNPRLGRSQIAWMARHGGSRLLVIDHQFLDLVRSVIQDLPAVELVVVTGIGNDPPPIGDKRTISFERFIGGARGTVDWGGFDENAAAGLCYTSGTTGDPKGVLYSHRSNFLHAFIANQPNGFGIRACDVVLPIVPMFHANAWGLAFIAPMAGAALVLPGQRLGGASLFDLMEGQGVTFAAAVPTVWQTIHKYLVESGNRLSTLRRIMVGGSAVPASVIEAFERMNIEVIHGWGMTETSPLGMVTATIGDESGLSDERRLARKTAQGRTLFPIEAIIVDEHGEQQSKDGTTPGLLKVKGPTVVDTYFGSRSTSLDAQGFFDTGDVAVIDEFGFVRLVDRAKDVVKSGGEFISTIDLENLAMGHPAVLRAAVVAIDDEKWGERPLLVVEADGMTSPAPAAILAYLEPFVPKWWLPEKMAFCAIPLGATGKIDKVALRRILASADAPPQLSCRPGPPALDGAPTGAMPPGGT